MTLAQRALELLRAARSRVPAERGTYPISMHEWVGSASVYGGLTLYQQTLNNGDIVQSTSSGWQPNAQRLVANPVAFALVRARAEVFSMTEFVFQRMENGRPSDFVYDDPQLDLLRTPWPGGTTQDLLWTAEVDVSAGGNSFFTRLSTIERLARAQGKPWRPLLGGMPESLVRLQPDWAYVVRREIAPGFFIPIGIAYSDDGSFSADTMWAFRLEDVMHYKPLTDPNYPFRGMSWLTPLIDAINTDEMMERHRRRYFENGAAPSMLVQHPANSTTDQVRDWARLFREMFVGPENAGKPVHLTVDRAITTFGDNFKDTDFSTTQAAGEVRMAAAAGVPPLIAGLYKGLDAATYQNYPTARRVFVDKTIAPMWMSFAGSAQVLVDAPANTRLWYDSRNNPFLREDSKDVAEIQANQASTMVALANAGWDPDMVVTAVMANDLKLLVDNHSGFLSVQLQRPGVSPGPVQRALAAPAAQLPVTEEPVEDATNGVEP